MLLRGKCKGNAQIYAEACLEMRLIALGDNLSSTKRVLATLWEMPKEYWRHFQLCLQSRGYTLGSTQIKVEI
jgi:hypothetical protein